jgi:hypothetical protein
MVVTEVIETIFKEVSGDEEVSGDGESEQEGEEKEDDDVLLDPSIDGIVFLKTKAIYARDIFKGEATLWLKAIHRRLSRKRRVRQPFYNSFTRDVPMAIFEVLETLVTRLGFSRPSCYVERNSKAVAISFTNMDTTKVFLSVLSAIPAIEIVDQYFKKTLKGKKSGSVVEVLVREEKQFGLTYFIRRGQLEVSFYFGDTAVNVHPLFLSN